MAERAEIDDIRARTDIVATIERYVTLKRAGRVFKGLCPFHNEKTPSFQVNPQMGIWKCFGCGEGGDVIEFVQKIENLSFPETLERLASRAGVTLTKTASGNQYGEPSERDRIYRVNGLALRYYREMLAHPEPQRYLEERLIHSEIQEEFNLGYAPDAWDGLTSFLAKQSVPADDAVLAGLIMRSERGGYYDRLRGRLIFPIFDVQDRPIAFGGRLLAPSTNGQPKYWNSPEHPAFSKSRTLYGLNRARNAIAQEGFAIVVEGYTDVTSAHQSGFKNVVAPLGTALTEQHVRALKLLAPLVLLCFDADSAGLKAAFRAGEIFESSEVEVKVLDLPAGEDPDSLLRSGRREEFVQAIANATPLMEYRFRRLIRQNATATDNEKLALLRKGMPILASVKSVVERDQYIKMLAPYHPGFRHGSSNAEEQIRQDVAGHLNSRSRRPAETEAGGNDVESKTFTVRDQCDRAERDLLRALLSNEALFVRRVLESIEPNEFLTPYGRQLAAIVMEYLRAHPQANAGAVIASAENVNLSMALTDIAMSMEEPLTTRLLDETVAHVKRRSADTERMSLKDVIDGGQASIEQQRRYLELIRQTKGSSSHGSSERRV